MVVIVIDAAQPERPTCQASRAQSGRVLPPCALL